MKLRANVLLTLACANLGVAQSSLAEPTKLACVVANERAQDERHEGALLRARQSLATCLASSCPDAVREDCAARLLDVDAAIPSVVLSAVDPAGNDLSAVRVRVDSHAFAERLDGVAMPMDPGEHRFAFEAHGLPPEETTVVLHEREKGRVVRVTMEAPRAETRRRTMAAGILAAGAAAGVVGIVLGAAAKSTYDHALGAECGGDANACSLQGERDGHTAHAEATAATVALVTSGTLLAIGAALYFTLPRKGSVGVRAAWGAGCAALAVAGAW
jgi:hypothetical protein